MQRNPENAEIIKIIADVEKTAKTYSQENIFLQLESQQFIRMVISHLRELINCQEITKIRLEPLKNLLQSRIRALMKSPANFHANEGGAANIVTFQVSIALTPLIGEKHPQWLFQPEVYSSPDQFGVKDPTEGLDKLAAIIMKRCFETDEPQKINPIKLAELLQGLPKNSWKDFFSVFPEEDKDLAKQLSNGLLRLHIDTYLQWKDKNEVFKDRINEGLNYLATFPEIARIYFFLFCELYYRIRKMEPEYKSDLGAFFSRFNSVAKVVSTREDKLSACRMLQRFLTSDSFSSLDNNIEQYFDRQQKKELYKEAQKDCLGIITEAIVKCAGLIQAHRLREQLRPG